MTKTSKTSEKVTNLTNNDESFYSKNTQFKILNLEQICIFSFHIFCSAIFFAAIFYSLKLITNGASEFFKILTSL